MTIQISSYAFVFLCPNNSLSWTWRNSSAGISPGEPKTWPTPPVLRSPINLSWYAVSRGSAETETETLSNNQKLVPVRHTGFIVQEESIKNLPCDLTFPFHFFNKCTGIIYSFCFLHENCGRYAVIFCIPIEQEPFLVFA